MKKFLLIILGFILFAGNADANRKFDDAPNPKMWKEIQEFKMKFLAQEMNLDRDQRVKFYETYSELSDKKKSLFYDIRKAEKELDGKKDATEEDYAAASAKINEAKQKDAALDKEYDAKFAKFLTSKQIYQMKSGEEKFRRRMSEMMNNKKHKSLDKNKNKK